MEDADVLHSLLTVKEMIQSNYGPGNELFDELLPSSGAWTGEGPQTIGQYSEPLPRFMAPIFQPKVLTRVPSIDRSRLLFPLNIADFIYEKGVKVMSAREV